MVIETVKETRLAGSGDFFFPIIWWQHCLTFLLLAVSKSHIQSATWFEWLTLNLQCNLWAYFQLQKWEVCVNLSLISNKSRRARRPVSLPFNPIGSWYQLTILEQRPFASFLPLLLLPHFHLQKVFHSFSSSSSSCSSSSSSFAAFHFNSMKSKTCAPCFRNWRPGNMDLTQSVSSKCKSDAMTQIRSQCQRLLNPKTQTNYLPLAQTW